MDALTLLRTIAAGSVTFAAVTLLTLYPHSQMLAFALMLPVNTAGRTN